MVVEGTMDQDVETKVEDRMWQRKRTFWQC